MDSQIPPASCYSPKNKLICLSASLIILLVVALVAFAPGRNSLPRSSKEALRDAAPVPACASIFVTPVPDYTANWKLYTNNEFGFEFKHPSDYSIESEAKTLGAEPQVIISFSKSTISQESHPDFSVALTRTNLSIMDWIKSKGYCPSSFDSCTSYLGGGSLPGSLKFQGVNKNYGGTNIYFKNGDLIYDFSVAAGEPEGIYNLILSTFKFLSQTTFLNDNPKAKVKYALKYPSDWRITSHEVGPRGAGYDDSRDLVVLSRVGYSINIYQDGSTSSLNISYKLPRVISQEILKEISSILESIEIK